MPEMNAQKVEGILEKARELNEIQSYSVFFGGTFYGNFDKLEDAEKRLAERKERYPNTAGHINDVTGTDELFAGSEAQEEYEDLLAALEWAMAELTQHQKKD